MATVPAVARQMSGMRWGSLVWAVPLLAALAAGCVTSSSWLSPDDDTLPPKPSQACQVVAVWQNSVAFASDPAHGGNPAPGFAGRVYLFGPNIDFPRTAEGGLVVDMIDETTQPPRWLERWNVDSENLQRLVKKDYIGWGYTVFLPSKELRPEMTKIRLRTAFQAPKGTPVYGENVITLAQDNGVVRQSAAKSFNLPGQSTVSPVAQSAAQMPATKQPPIPFR